ncbi:MAG: hypothetical protein KDK65_06060 [Chlamydiia bacterium]|nr:hypothetical protein [Chlamydiia bacterium]
MKLLLPILAFSFALHAGDAIALRKAERGPSPRAVSPRQESERPVTDREETQRRVAPRTETTRRVSERQGTQKRTVEREGGLRPAGREEAPLRIHQPANPTLQMPLPTPLPEEPQP